MTEFQHPSLPFVVEAFGRFEPAQVRVTMAPAPRPTTPELEALIAAEWDRQMGAAKRADRWLFNGPLLRYVDHAVTRDAKGPPEAFHLRVGPTCYRDFVGTNLFNHDRLDEFGWHRFANPIGTTATLTTGDGKICYGRRSARVAYHALHIHTFGGALEERDRKPDGTIDAFGSVRRELEEELDLGPPDLSDLVCVGLVRDKEICQPEMLFEVRTPLTAERLRTRWRSAPSCDEHIDIVDLADEPDAIVPFIRNCDRIAPVAVAALFLHGRLRWGEDWYRRAASER